MPRFLERTPSAYSTPALCGAIALALSMYACGGGDDGDDGPPCPPTETRTCDPVEQRCCEPYEFCMAFFSGGYFQDTCRSSQGEVAEGGACLIHEISGEDGCQAGHICLMIPGVDTQANCHRLCHDDSDCVEGTCEHELERLEPVKACVVR